MTKCILTLAMVFHFSAHSSLKESTTQLQQKHASKVTPEVKKVMGDFFSGLKEQKIAERALKIGVKAPDFKINTANGTKNFSELYKDGPILVNFYRGSWCSYCMLELKEYQKLQAKFKDQKVKIISLTPDKTSEIAKTKKKHSLSFPIYQDKENQIAKKFGIAFTMNPEITKLYQSFGIDLQKAQGNNKNQLPLPGVYVVDTSGMIAYAYVDVDYRKRAEPSSILTYIQDNINVPAAKEFELTAASGKKIKLSQFKGKKVVLEWLNHGCPFVKKHYQSGNMQALQKKYTDRGVVWLSVISSAPGKQGYSTPEVALAQKKEFNSHADYILLDPTGEVGKMYQAKTTPHMYVVNELGRIAYQGAIDNIPSTDQDDVKGANNFIASALDSLMTGEKVSANKTKPYGCSVKYQ